jgi:hypothetical protein
MPASLTQLTDRLIAPAVKRRLASTDVEKATRAFAAGALRQPGLSLKDVLGRYPDAAYGPIASHFRPRRHRLTAAEYRQTRHERFASWRAVTGTPAVA